MAGLSLEFYFRTVRASHCDSGHGVSQFKCSQPSYCSWLGWCARGRTVAAGLALALPCVAVLGKFVQSQLFGVTATDPPTIALAATSSRRERSRLHLYPLGALRTSVPRTPYGWNRRRREQARRAYYNEWLTESASEADASE
jgi:hypothetical protein